MNEIISKEDRMSNREKLIRMLEHRRQIVIENMVERYQKNQARKAWHKKLK